MGLKQDILMFFALIGVFTFVALIIFALGLFPSSMLDSLPSSLRDAISWTNANADVVLGVLIGLLALYMIAKVAVWADARRKGRLSSSGGP